MVLDGLLRRETPREEVTLVLSQSDGTIAGTINGTELTGAVDGATLRAHAHYAYPTATCAPGFDGPSVCRIDADIAGTADALDRLHGTLTYHVSGLDDANHPYAFDAATSREGLVRRP